MSLLEKENQAIKFIKSVPTENAQIAFSGGKDSIVLYYLAKQANVDVQIIYGNTTIDPVGTKRLIREHYPDVKILTPPKGFFQLVAEKGLPTRVGRFCCQHLKERYGIGMRNIEGVRREESSKRKIYEPEMCDQRTEMKGAKHYFPILDFSSKEIWQIIKSNDLQTLPYYYPPYNWSRHGCVGCPLASGKQQIKEYKVFPKYAKAMVKAIERNLKKGNKLGQNFTDPYEVFWFWISKKTIPEWISERNKLFEINYKEQFEQTLNVC